MAGPPRVACSPAACSRLIALSKTSWQFTGASVNQGLRLLTANPAAMTGFSEQTGSLAVGQPADLVAVDASGKLLGSLIGGQPVQ